MTIDNSKQSVANSSKSDELTKLRAFFQKHALGALARPSCLVCSQPPKEWPPGIQHAELPEIVVCTRCRDAGQQAAHETDVEPTPEMIRQGIWAWERNERGSTADDVRAIYIAMRRMEGRTEKASEQLCNCGEFCAIGLYGNPGNGGRCRRDVAGLPTRAAENGGPSHE
jgi:hypothetical protein